MQNNNCNSGDDNITIKYENKINNCEVNNNDVDGKADIPQDVEAGRKASWYLHFLELMREADEEEEAERRKREQELHRKMYGGIFNSVVADGLADQCLTEGLISPEILNNHAQYVADRLKHIAKDVAETGRRGPDGP